ncbi:MAG TPA: hypothetical protein VHZ09_07800 [Acidobacteriaceae bacterium]|jgi:hypothetical protein|nr:hypothetical protein [Acidobacteriaceae bacterium]
MAATILNKMRHITITNTADGVIVEVFPREYGALWAVTSIIVALLCWGLFAGSHSSFVVDFIDPIYRPLSFTHNTGPAVFVFVTAWAVGLSAIGLWGMEKGILSVRGPILLLEHTIDLLHCRWSRSFQLEYVNSIHIAYMGKYGRPTLAFGYQSKKYYFSARGLQETQIKEIIVAIRNVAEIHKSLQHAEDK